MLFHAAMCASRLQPVNLWPLTCCMSGEESGTDAAASPAEQQNHISDTEPSEESWGGAVATPAVSIDSGPCGGGAHDQSHQCSPVVAALLLARPVGQRRGRPARADALLWRQEVPSSVQKVARGHRCSAIGDIQSGVVSEAACVFR